MNKDRVALPQLKDIDADVCCTKLIENKGTRMTLSLKKRLSCQHMELHLKSCFAFLMMRACFQRACGRCAIDACRLNER